MNVWMLFWGILFVVTLLLYGALVVNVTIGGFTDIWAMIRKLSDDHSADEEP